MLWRSMNSLMSILTSASSVPNMNSASAFASSVLPTPVGPRKRKLPIGRFGSFSPARARRTARLSVEIACSCPTTRALSVSSIFRSRAVSASAKRITGMPVHIETTAATSSSVTTGRVSSRDSGAEGAAIASGASTATTGAAAGAVDPGAGGRFRLRRQARSSSSMRLLSPSPWLRSERARSKAPAASASRWSRSTASASRRAERKSAGGDECRNITRLEASSITSIALSGSCRSLM